MVDIPKALTDLLAEGGRMIIPKQLNFQAWMTAKLRVTERQDDNVIEQDPENPMRVAFVSFMKHGDRPGQYIDVGGNVSGRE